MGIQDQYDIIVAGSGFCGSVIARLAAEECGKRVLVLEKRGHIAGNMYDETDADGFLIQKYGPHIFHTDEDWICEFVSRFSEWTPYKVYYGVELDGRCIPAPFGFQAIRMLYSERDAEKLIGRLKSHYPDRKSVPVLELMECPDDMISAFAETLYRKNYRPYAAKQWNLAPEELDRSVVARMPVILSERRNYFDVKYEMLPKKGYTAFFQQLLSHEKIDVRVNTDACRFLQFDVVNGVCGKDGEALTIPVIFTGALEELVGDPGDLPYRSLHFEYRSFPQSSYQPMAIVTYPQEHEYLRTTEFSKLTPRGPEGKTAVAFEYPVPYSRNSQRGSEPYYPILTPRNIAKNGEYLAKLGRIENVYPCGRLADYQYYNMDQAIIRAFDVFRSIKRKYWNP